MIKLTATAGDAITEAAALRRWAGTGAAVGLVDIDAETGSLLLERLRPGTPMPRGALFLEPAASVLNALHRAPSNDYPFPALAGTSSEHEREVLDDLMFERRSRGEPERAVGAELCLPSAGRLMERLCATAEDTVVLHGDFLTKNLLSVGDSYRAIDPIARYGDPCADVGAFASDQPAAAILDTAAELARLLDLSVDRVIAWSTVWTVMLTAQAWRPDQEELDTVVASRFIQNVIHA